MDGSDPEASGPAEGRLLLSVALSGGKVAGIKLVSTRPLRACRVLLGREVGEALRLLPLLFGICGAAQTAAGLAACEAALGIVPDPSFLAGRALALRAEAAGRQIRRFLVDWPLALGHEPKMREARVVLGLLAKLAAAAGDWRRLGGGPLQAGDASRSNLIAGIGSALGEAEPVIQGLLRQVEREGFAGLGAFEGRFLPALDPAWVEDVLGGDGADAFAARPVWRGHPAETGALARRQGDPPVASVLAVHGDGLLARLMAHFVEFQAIPAELAAPRDGVRGSGAAGSGVGIVETARGALAHRVLLSQGRVEGYAVLAPTEWNFHPEGGLAQGLVGASAPDPAAVGRQLRLLAAALDPCVACTVEIGES